MARKRKSKKLTVTKENELSVNPFELDIVQVEELRRKLAKRANQRLVRLERTKLGDEEGTRGSDLTPAQYAYEKIRKIRGEGATRFRERKMKLGEAPESQRMELAYLQSFLSERGSRYGAVKRETSKTQKTFEERGISIASYKSFYNFLNSAQFSFLKQFFDSETIVEMLQEAKGEENTSFKKINEIVTEYVKFIEAEKAADEEYQPSVKELAERLGVNAIRVQNEVKEYRKVKDQQREARQKSRRRRRR